MIKVVLLLVSLFYSLIAPNLAYAAACDPNKPNPNDCPGPAGLNEIEQVFTGVVSTSVALGFIAMLVMIVVAGIKYLTSGGEQKAIQSAHQTMTWAIMGVLFLALSWIALQLLAAFTGIDALKVFNIKTLIK